MKKSIAIILSIVLVMAIILPTAAFSSIAVKGIKLNTTKFYLKVGETSNLKAILIPANTTQKKLTYTTGNKKVATVDSVGKVTGVSAGTTTITVYTLNKNVYAKCAVTVTNVADTNVQVKKPKLHIMTWPASAQFPDGKSIMNNEFYNLIKAESGYDIKWSLFKSGFSGDEQIMLLMASGDAPDMMQVGLSPIISFLAKNGGLADLSQAFDKNANFLKKIYDKDAIEAQKINGKMYYLWRYVTPPPFVGSMAIRTDWLKELGLSVPKTINEYYNVLKKFKETKKDAVPLLVDGGFYRFAFFASAFGVNTVGCFPSFTIENGKASYPLLSDKSKEFIKAMNSWYKEGLIDKEFLVDKEILQKMLAGKGGMMMLNHVEMIRNIRIFNEKNPNATLEYIEPPVGKNGEGGHIYQNNGITLVWIVPKTSAKKADHIVKFLDVCNSNTKISDAICYGIEGTHYKKEGSEIIALPDYSKSVFKGYYSRIILDMKFDTSWVKLEGGTKYYDDAFKKGKPQLNEILNKPFTVPATNATYEELNKTVSNGIMEMIVNGYSDAAFNTLKDKFNNLKGDQMLKEIQAWYDSAKK